jgi:DNA-binding PucR family transcriptional regulator
VDWPNRVSLAIGESSRGLAGWRLTHRQARAAVPVAKRSSTSSTRYSNVALVASMLQDDLLSTSLRELYLDPLSDERDGGEALRQTLSAYISSDRNLSSAAALLGVSRRTVANRLSAVEGKIGRLLTVAMADIEAALRLHELETPPADPAARTPPA